MNTIKVEILRGIAVPPGEPFNQGDIVNAPEAIAKKWIQLGIARSLEEEATDVPSEETKASKREKAIRSKQYEAR